MTIFFLLCKAVNANMVPALDKPWAIRKGVEPELIMASLALFQLLIQLQQAPVSTPMLAKQRYLETGRLLRIGDALQDALLSSAEQKAACSE